MFTKLPTNVLKPPAASVSISIVSDLLLWKLWKLDFPTLFYNVSTIFPYRYGRGSVSSEMSNLIFLFKCKLGLFNIESSDYVKLRPIPKYDLRAYDVNNFSEFKCRTVYFRNSYFPRVVRK